jgi:spore maturation protein CgeB
MRIVMFYHSLISDWNHGNAHFLRGVVTNLLARGHHVDVYEPADGWSLANLKAEHGEQPLHDFRRVFPHMQSIAYAPDRLNLDAVLAEADLVIVHEWNEHKLVQQVGQHHRRNGGYALLFHDTHHRSISDSQSIGQYDLSGYDGVLAFGRVIRDRYLQQKWAQRAWTWHEAADVTIFRPHPDESYTGDLVWVGNWGDNERQEQLAEFLFEPVHALGLQAAIHGVRYPAHALAKLRAAGIHYRGWLPNHQVPQVFARHRLTVHIPRQFYVQMLPGIPTIRVFEALACGIPLVCSPWHDVEGLFTPGKDYLVAQDGEQMRQHLRFLLHEPAAAHELAAHGLKTVLARHTCAQRVDELLTICQELGVDVSPEQEQMLLEELEEDVLLTEGRQR